MSAPAKKWAWLFQPLDRKMRLRLELWLGVVLSGAAVVGLSTVIRPDPSKLAGSMTYREAPVGDPRREDVDLRAVPVAPPKVSPDFAHAVARGDLATMNQLSTPGMALDGMLAIAAGSGENEATVWLLDHGADVKEDEGTVDSPLLIADDHPEITALLLARGAPESSLDIAAQASAFNAVVRLLAARTVVDPLDASPLNSAVWSTRGKPETRKLVIDKLLVAGANPNREDGINPFASAVRTCDPSVDQFVSEAECLGLIKLLVKHGARASGEAIIAALQLNGSARDTSFDALLKGPLARGATATALAQAWNVPPADVKRLVSKGVDWAWHDGENDAALPLLAAVQRGERDVVRTLLDAGAPPDVHYKDSTCALGAAIDGAAGGGNADFARIVELLVARGTDVNRRLPDGRTPLFAAAEGGDLRVVQALLDRGARVNDLILDDTALDAAERNGHEPAARVLHSRGARRAKGL